MGFEGCIEKLRAKGLELLRVTAEGRRMVLEIIYSLGRCKPGMVEIHQIPGLVSRTVTPSEDLAFAKGFY